MKNDALTKNKNNRMYVITGGPGTGKTTLLEALAKKGFSCVDEVARDIIREQMEIGGNALPWKDTALYTALMLERSVESYKKYCYTEEVLFFDRGIPDTLAYAYLIGLEDKSSILDAVKSYRYHSHVFLLPPWKEIYCTDSERKQSWEEAVGTYHVMKKTYQEVGYNSIEVPPDTVEERTDFIIKHL